MLQPQYVLLHSLTCGWCAQVGYQVAAAKFVVFFALMFLMLLISETLGILCAGFHRTELVGLIILSVFYLPLLMFTGFIQVHSLFRAPCLGTCRAQGVWGGTLQGACACWLLAVCMPAGSACLCGGKGVWSADACAAVHV